jgi:ATP-binding cassette, subfamily B, bacterial MsbA
VNNFFRAIRDSLNHWPTIVLATVCSLGVAALWSANIGALWPVIDTALHGKSVQVWLADDIVKSETKIAELQAEVALAQQQGEAADEDNLAEIKSEQNKISYSNRMLSWAKWGLPADPFQTICFIMGILVVSTLIKHLLLFANEYLIGMVSTSIVRNLRIRIFDQALNFDRKTFQAYGTSGLLATITHTAESLSVGLISFFGSAIREPLRIIGCLIGAGLICWRLLLLSLVLTPLFVAVLTWFNRSVKSISRSLLNRNASFHEVILEALSNIFTVQAYTMEDKERERFAGSTRDMQWCGLRMILYSGLSKPFTELIGVGMIAITICAGAYLIVNGETHILGLRICDQPMTISGLLIFFGFLVGASDPLRKLSGVFTNIYGGVMAAEAIYQILDYPIQVQEPKDPKSIIGNHKMMEIDNVSFHYQSGCPVLKDINLRIPFGSTIAIVGANGSGKSTLIQLLCRFYDPTEGKISLDGIDYREQKVVDVRRRIALVSQHTELFNRTVYENILYGNPSCSKEEVEAAAKLAHAHEFITTALPEGYETVVGQGGQRLSGGQRQRVALARAILRKPEILILDESTSQIDMQSEIQIRQSLAELKGSCTIIIITHRVALLELTDEIYEVSNGQMGRMDASQVMAA